MCLGCRWDFERRYVGFETLAGTTVRSRAPARTAARGCLKRRHMCLGCRWGFECCYFWFVTCLLLGTV
jgi:hypothetical protein